VSVNKGSEKAIALMEVLAGASLHGTACESFGVEWKLKAEIERLKTRQSTKETFFFLTDAIQEWIDEHSSPNAQFLYPNTFDVLNRGLFGKPAKQIKMELGIGKGSLNRDHFNDVALKRIEYVQRHAEDLIKEDGIHPIEAVKKAIARRNYQPIEYKRIEHTA